ncbi:putative hydrolase of the HAD superfamily [Haladaptatus litoreus]|uniref:Putative hydrolase of the HAD superfamily n=1 Tax=Haladaptatus litoreus TaxID=553468 RepID=A0A1N6ZQE9_9EURY|nr:HAD family hydrolase [Haladaptatus litoreus]SIR29017.1 putative hydrolase of the HAD superfamily [Haladaptatus litoreus]
MDIDTVLFDLDDTLLEYEQDSRDVLSSSFDRVGVEPFFDIPAYHARYDEFLERGKSVDEQRSNCFAAIARDAEYDPNVGRTVAEAFADIRDQSRVRYLLGAPVMLETLARDYALGIVTNGSPEMQRTKMTALGIDEYVDAIVFAGHDARAKPHPELFESALAELDSTPERAIHVGNSLSTDVPGAKAAGLGAVWVPANPEITPDPTPDFAFETLHPLAEHPWRSA